MRQSYASEFDDIMQCDDIMKHCMTFAVYLDVGVGQDELSNGAVIGESIHSVANSEDEHAR